MWFRKKRIGQTFDLLVDDKFLLNFEEIDTSEVKELSDRELINRCRISEIFSGWGQLAELLKRFESHAIIVQQLKDSDACRSYPVMKFTEKEREDIQWQEKRERNAERGTDG